MSVNREQGRQSLAVTLWVALAACLIYAVSSGIRGNYGVMLGAISESSGVSYESVSLVLAVSQLSFGIMQPVFGALALKRSNGFVLCCGALLVGGGLLMIPGCRSAWMLMLFLGILMPAGTGALSFGIIMGAITPVLGERRAAAVSGFVSASSGLGSTILSPLIQRLLEAQGLWGTMAALSVPALTLIPVSLWLARFQPAVRMQREEPQGSLLELFRDAARHRGYLYLLLGFFTCGFHMAIIETHLYTQITTYGFSEATAALAFSFYGIATMAGSVVSGLLCSRIPMRWVLSGFFAARPLVILAWLLLPKHLAVVYAFAALAGFTGASTVPPTSGLVGALFGPAKLATLFGMVFLSHQIGSFFSAWLGGVSVSATGGYGLIWCVSAGLSLLAAGVSVRIRTSEAA